MPPRHPIFAFCFWIISSFVVGVAIEEVVLMREACRPPHPLPGRAQDWLLRPHYNLTMESKLLARLRTLTLVTKHRLARRSPPFVARSEASAEHQLRFSVLGDSHSMPAFAVAIASSVIVTIDCVFSPPHGTIPLLTLLLIGGSVVATLVGITLCCLRTSIAVDLSTRRVRITVAVFGWSLGREASELVGIVVLPASRLRSGSPFPPWRGFGVFLITTSDAVCIGLAESEEQLQPLVGVIPEAMPIDKQQGLSLTSAF